MNSLPSTLETAILVTLAAWLLGNLLYALPFPPLRRQLERFNPGLWFAHWTVFGAGDNRAEMASYTFEYRDGEDRADGKWIEVIRGRPWCWHAFLWQPERRVADRLHRLAEGVARTRDLTTAAARDALTLRKQLISAFIEARHPRASETPRAIRVVMKRSVIAAGAGSRTATEELNIQIEERVLLAFPADAAPDAR